VSSRRAKGRVSHAERYRIRALQLDIDYQAHMRKHARRYGGSTGPQRGQMIAQGRMLPEHWRLHHSGRQTTAPLPGTRAERRRRAPKAATR